MTDGLAHGVDQIGTFEPIQLWAGEPNGQTTQGRAAQGFLFGKKNARGETYKFPVVALVAGLLVPWDPQADGDVPNAWATGTMTIANAVPVAGDKFTINGVDVTYAADPDEAEFEIAIGATVTDAAVNLKNFINTHRAEFDTDLLLVATNVAGVVTLKAPGVAGNAITLAKTFATGANGSVSGANLTGGTDSDAEAGGARVPYGVLPHALDTTATGYDAPVDTPVFISGHPNFDALDLPEGTVYQEIKAAFAGTMINVQKLG
jgi:hypothetical protein